VHSLLCESIMRRAFSLSLLFNYVVSFFFLNGNLYLNDAVAAAAYYSRPSATRVAERVFVPLSSNAPLCF
jgi:hypothetical protein